MKRCLKCKRVPSDDSLAFCRTDGGRIVFDSQSLIDDETVALQPHAAIVSTTVLEPPVESNRVLDRPAASTSSAKLSSKTSEGSFMEKKRDKIGTRVIAIATLIALLVVYSSSSLKSNSVNKLLAAVRFTMINNDQQLNYLSDGMNQTLITSLSQLQNLSVKSISSVSCYKGMDVPPRTVVAELNVQTILNGHISQRGDIVTLSVELADALTENVIWSEQYRRKLGELVSLQSEIAGDVAAKLRVKLPNTDDQRLLSEYTTNADVYRRYLKGRFYDILLGALAPRVASGLSS